jgi:hypothetical protein
MIGRWLRVSALGAGLVLGIGVLPGSAASLNLVSQNLTPYRTCTITATPTTTTAVRDAYVDQNGAAANQNFGSATTISVSNGTNSNERVYVSFDLTACSPAIPTSASVRLATLRIYLTAMPSGCKTVDIFRVTAAWAETTITWNNQPFGTTLNNPPTAARTGSFDAGPQAGCQNQPTGVYVVGATVTADVAQFVAGTATNFGWMLRDDAEGSTPSKIATFSAKDLGTVDQMPQLVITYVTVP